MSIEETFEQLLRLHSEKMREAIREDIRSELRAALPPQAPVTVAEAAKVLKRSQASVRRDCRAGILPMVSVGKRGMRVDLARLKSYDISDVKAHLRAKGV